MRLEQALDNLVENAFVYGAGSVVLAAVADDGRVELHVRDEGPGVPEEFLPWAFDRFSRADEARGGGGTGLGLAIVDLVARAHGGEARLRNRPEGGADAWLSLRRVIDTSQQAFITLSSGVASMWHMNDQRRATHARDAARGACAE